MQSMVKAPKIGVVNSQNTKKSWPRFDLVVAAVTIESMGVTPPAITMYRNKQKYNQRKGKVVQHKPKVQR